MAKRRKGRHRVRHRRAKKSKGGHKPKKVALGVTIGSGVAAYNVLVKPQVAGYGGLYQQVTTKGVPMARRVSNTVMIAKAIPIQDVVVPIGVGILVSAAGRFLKLNKYVNMIPVIGKRVRLRFRWLGTDLGDFDGLVQI